MVTIGHKAFTLFTFARPIQYIIDSRIEGPKNMAGPPYSRDCIDSTISVFPVARIDKEVLYMQTFVVVEV